MRPPSRLKPSPHGVIALPSYPARIAHLTALWAFGVTQPVFSMLQGNPEFLVVRGSTRADVVIFTLLLAFLPPVLIVAAEALVSVVWAMLARALHVAVVWCFSFLAVLQLLRLVEPERAASLLVPILPACLVTFAYLRWSPLRSFLSISLVLPIAGAMLFVAKVPLAVDDRPGHEVDVQSDTPVVLVVFDEFPVSSLLRADGTLDGRRYPNFGRLARDSVWYPRATSGHVSTSQAVPMILTGLLPREGGLPTLRDHPDNLFTLLGESYTVRAFEQATRLCPSRYCPRTRRPVPVVDRQRGLFYDTSVGYLHGVLPGALREGLPPIGQRWGGFGEGDDMDVRELILGALDSNAWHGALHYIRGKKRAQFQSFLQSLRPTTGRPTLYFEHAELPHSPWGFLPSGREYGNTKTVEGIDAEWARWGTSRFLVEHALQRHLLQVGYTDRLVGQLVRRLETVGLYDRALVIVTADHGVSFRQGGYMRNVSSENLADIAGVPLFVKYPGQREGRIDTRGAQTSDVLPTIADVIDVRIPWRVDGTSLLGELVRRPVVVRSFNDEAVRSDHDTVEAGVHATARRNAHLFGEGGHTLYRIGPHPELIGRPVRAFATLQVEGATVRFADAELLADVRPTLRFVPSRFLGSIRGNRPPVGTPLALAINGRIAAMTEVYEADGSRRFVALVPERSFREGRNDVDLYAVEVLSSGLRLKRLGGTTSRPSSTSVSLTGSDAETNLESRLAPPQRETRETTAISSSR